MNFSNNTFSNTREIHSFTKTDILEIKKMLAKFKSENTDENIITDYLRSKIGISFEILDEYFGYLENLKNFVKNYFIPIEDSKYYFLKSDIMEELQVLTSSLQNLSSNIRNINRFTKNNFGLKDLLLKTEDLLKEMTRLGSEIQDSIKESENIYSDTTQLWIEINKIKNLNYKLNEIPTELEYWNEIKELVIFIRSLNEVFLSRRKKDKKEIIITFHFDDIYQYFLSLDESRIKFYSDLIYLLYLNKIFEEYQGEEFVNILERKEVLQSLKDFILPIVNQLIEDKLQDILNEIELFDVKEKDSKIALKNLLKQKISDYFPKIVDNYIVGLEKNFQEKIHNVIDADKFEEIANFYYQKIDNFANIISQIEDWVLSIENLLKPYESITTGLRKVFSNLTSDIYRRKNEYLTFIKTVKDEELRVEIRRFVSDKISEINDLIRVYEDEASLIIKEEFPQLKRIREILNDYNQKIQSIKAEVYKKLNSMKSHDIDAYNAIKYWEDSLNRKKQQLTFLISLILNKLFKSFKELLDKEGILFATITEITEQTENFEGLPLNFALSSFLAEKLSEEELRERISEIKAKINQLNNSLGLYQVEASKLETILTNRVKLRKGISKSDVQCTVCHKYINFAENKVITCPFCGSTYHYLCVAFWLSKYNSCPMCQNNFLEPHSDLFENEEDQELERY
ncbi:MAG: hypothetical protein ACFFCE_20140 [Promethearchaeota archaeon]